ncbi:hypothetical protein [Halobellus sp. GM3]|uniref:hypothetical protein n=1 Tax=Halobellus sp. GM3 TaxID=3458410 RepID=UPI00403E2A48
MSGELRTGIHQLVEEEVFPNKSALIRTAIRDLLEEHGALTNQPERHSAREHRRGADADE